VRAADDGANGEEDGWRGARIGAETRDRHQRAMRKIPADVDIGDPGPPRVVIGFLVLAIVATVLEFASFGASPTTSELSQAGGAGIGVVATGAWWKLLVSNLLHGNVAHVAMNVFVIFLTGRWLEHLAGRMLVLATIGWSAVAAGIGSLVVDTPSVAIGASGVAFGLVGCAIGVDPRARTATGLIARQLGIVNVILTFVIPGISIGGHLGGLAAGLAIGFLGWSRTTSEAHPAGRARTPVATSLAIASLVPIALLAVGPTVLPGEAAGFRGATTSWLLGRQLSGTTLSSGTSIDDAECEPGVDELTFECTTDGSDVRVRFSTRDDQWGLRPVSERTPR
jgi:membrane associated rhomboid family serine protease